MTEQELIYKQKEYGDSRFAVTRSGKFFCAYGCGAFALVRATGYRVMRCLRKGEHAVLTTGFPESRLANVLEQKPPKEHKDTGIRKDKATLRERIMSFDLSRSTPMEAMLFLDTLQK